jgi:hypothetical protein
LERWLVQKAKEAVSPDKDQAEHAAGLLDSLATLL